LPGWRICSFKAKQWVWSGGIDLGVMCFPPSAVLKAETHLTP